MGDRATKAKDGMCKNCGKKGHGHKECRSPVITCFYYKEKGHRSYECTKPKKRDSSSTTEGSTAAVVAVGQNDETATKDEGCVSG